MRTIKINIYNFDELKSDIQQYVISNYIEETIETTDFEDIVKDSNLYKAYKKCEELQTPWFLSGLIWEYCREEILESVKHYEYYENGELYFE